MPITTYTFDAFLSYSHRDLRIAESIQIALESYRASRAPGVVTMQLRVFRDQTDLSLAPDLLPILRQKIRDSRFLILLASPEAAASPIVRRELDYLIADKRLDQLLLVLVRGEPQESITPLLGTNADSMPFYLDLRDLAERRRYRIEHVRHAILPLTAALLEVNLDELVCREESRRRTRHRRVIVGVFFGLVLACLIAILAGARVEVTPYAEISLTTLGEEQNIIYGGVHRVSFAPAKPVLAMGANGGCIAVWDLSREDNPPHQIHRTGSVRAIAWDSSGSRVYATAGPLLWKLSTTGNTAPICFRADFELISLHPHIKPDQWLVGGPEGQVAVVNMQELLLVREWQTGRKDLDGIWLWDVNDILVHELTGLWWLLQATDGHLGELPLSQTTACPPLFDSHTCEAAFSEISDGGPAVVVVHLPEGRRKAELFTDAGYIPCALARQGNTVAIGLINGWIRLFSIPTGRRIDDARMSVPGEPQSIAFSACGSLLAVGYKDLASSEGGVRVFERSLHLFGIKLWRIRF